MADIPDRLKLDPTILTRLASLILVFSNSDFCFLGVGVIVFVKQNRDFEAFKTFLHFAVNFDMIDSLFSVLLPRSLHLDVGYLGSRLISKLVQP